MNRILLCQIIILACLCRPAASSLAEGQSRPPELLHYHCEGAFSSDKYVERHDQRRRQRRGCD